MEGHVRGGHAGARCRRGAGSRSACPSPGRRYTLYVHPLDGCSAARLCADPKRWRGRWARRWPCAVAPVPKLALLCVVGPTPASSRLVSSCGGHCRDTCGLVEHRGCPPGGPHRGEAATGSGSRALRPRRPAGPLCASGLTTEGHGALEALERLSRVSTGFVVTFSSSFFPHFAQVPPQEAFSEETRGGGGVRGPCGSGSVLRAMASSGLVSASRGWRRLAPLSCESPGSGHTGSRTPARGSRPRGGPLFLSAGTAACPRGVPGLRGVSTACSVRRIPSPQLSWGPPLPPPPRLGRVAGAHRGGGRSWEGGGHVSRGSRVFEPRRNARVSVT